MARIIVDHSDLEQLLDTYKIAEIHAELDWEININGNGVCACTVQRTLNYAFNVLGIPIPPSPTDADIKAFEMDES